VSPDRSHDKYAVKLGWHGLGQVGGTKHQHSAKLLVHSKQVKSQSTRRPRNPVAKAVRTPLYKMRVVESKRSKLLEKWTEAVRRGAKDVKGGSDER